MLNLFSASDFIIKKMGLLLSNPIFLLCSSMENVVKRSARSISYPFTQKVDAFKAFASDVAWKEKPVRYELANWFTKEHNPWWY